nr:unnamed protein product [Macaca fascicularis]
MPPSLWPWPWPSCVICSSSGTSWPLDCPSCWDGCWETVMTSWSVWRACIRWKKTTCLKKQKSTFGPRP